MAFVGIDLGTTYSVVASLDGNGVPQTIVNAEGDLTTPSVVLYEPSGEVIVGREAKMAALAMPEHVAFDVKRYMGDETYPKPLAGRLRSPVEISAEVLRKLKADAEMKLGPITGCVITVPAYFDESRRHATVQAGELAGLNVIDVINEPTAAAVAYAYRQFSGCNAAGATAAAQERTILIYDLGGGTFDVTLLRIKGTDFRVLATDGDIRLGGRDWDEELARVLAEQFKETHGEDPMLDAISREALLRTAEEIKMNLSSRSQAHYVVNHGGHRATGTVRRDEFEKATRSLLYRTERRVTRVLKAAALEWTQVDDVVATGGSSRMPQVRQMLKSLSGREANTTLSPDEAVAAGAAIHAASCVANSELKFPGAEEFLAQLDDVNALKSIKTTNVNAHSFGVVVMTKTGTLTVHYLIPRNTPLPASATKMFGTVAANQKRVTVEVVEGESTELEHCMPIGVCQIDGLPEGLPKNTPIEVTFTYDNSGRLSVKAHNPTTERWSAVTIDRKFGLGATQMMPM